MTRWSVALLGQADRRWCRPGASRPAVALHERRARGAPPKMEGDPGRAGACATRAGAGQARSSPLVGSSTGPLNGPGPVCCTSRAALCALGGCARARPEGESRPGCAKMRAPRRRTLRRGGRRAEAPFQGASAALSMATLAGAACVGRHELPCRHTAREFQRPKDPRELPSLSPCTGSRLPGLTRQGGKHTLRRERERKRDLEREREARRLAVGLVVGVPGQSR